MKKNYLLSKIIVLFIFCFAYTEVESQNCSGMPATSGITVPSFSICHGSSVSLSLNTTYTNTGIAFQWQSSSAALGPFTPISGATLSTYATPLLYSSLYYNVVITCTNTNSSFTTSPALVMVSQSYAVVPCYEGFSNIASNNQLPGCWLAPGLGTNCLTHFSVVPNGLNYASFHLNSSGPDYFYTNAISLKAGITYSISLWYKSSTNAANWTDLSILLGTSQSSVGMSTIASTGGPASSAGWVPLSNIFTVPADGIYFSAIRGTSSAGLAEYLYWDDFSIIIPCTGLGSVNVPTVTVQSSASTNTSCAGSQFTLSATGANAYTWSNSANTSTVSLAPLATTNYSVTGTNTLTGCTVVVSKLIVINPTPLINITATQNHVCPGNTVQISVVGTSTMSAASYTWFNGSTGVSITLTVQASTNYSVAATNTTGCVGSAVLTVFVHSPNVMAVSNPSTLCKGNAAVLTGSGAVTYQWGGYPPGNSVNVSPSSLTVYSVTGTDAYGCSNSATLALNVNPLPTVSLTSSSVLLCVGESATLTGSGGVTYQWTGSALTASANTALVSPNAPTNYMVTGTDLNGCKNSANIIVQVDKCTGISEINANENLFRIYPNPTSSSFEIRFDVGDARFIRITDLTGKIIYRGRVSGQNLQIDLNEFPNGVYYGEIKTINITQNFKIVKQ